MSRIVIIDPQPGSQRGIAAELERAGHAVVGTAGNGVDGLDAVRRARPDLVVLDLDIPRLGGLDVIRRLLSQQRGLRILVFTAFPAEVYEHLCVAAGARGFVDKHEALEVFGDAVDQLLAGKTYFNASAVHAQPPAGEAEDGPGERLTAREITVLHYLADGLRVKEIAGEMAISDRTVSTYKARLLEKTNTRSLVELLRVAAQRGLVATSAQGAARQPEAAGGEARFNALFDRIPYPICLRDADMRILAANRAMFDFLGIDTADLLGSRPAEVGLVELEHLDYARKTFEAAVEKRIPYMMVIAIRVKGERRVVKHSGVPVTDDDGAFLGMLCTTLDIGEQQRELEALREQLAYAHAIRKRRGQYLIEHGQAMAGDLASLRALLQGQGAQADMLLERLQQNTGLLNELVQLEQGLVSATPYVADLNQLTQQVLEQAPDGLLPAWNFYPDTHRRWGWVDAERYAQLVRTLLLHAMSLGAAQLDIHADSRETDIDHVSWRLRLLGRLGAPAAPLSSVRWLLAEQLATLLDGRLDLARGTDQALEIEVMLRMPRASSPY
ncbi:two-component system, NarL family, sensor histidine kinase EvgS/two-component system, NarL family, response regulator EvgA [Pseudomonas delhiensis]|uniref:Two-component system, NarL family, sensor histidine kinase EvgS n=1 Tax=Pseudomonas delhiensis TaxID=366289 RepID=A0A239K9I4_9PSED|nr:response regulator [Pseudomonas delhiensis]SDJ33578.1 two-component system, NarL family, sensor histidine kinase EvgS/two-component system, NarL family, response regulator EvgA [Pseudomonas delhiensis]SNT14630.1 two-component system, NarL family, sensor histidine kinase EvgS [Pseudomonas delhiensis]